MKNIYSMFYSFFSISTVDYTISLVIFLEPFVDHP